MLLGAGHCTSACLFVKWESYPSKVKSQECHFYKVLRAPQALQVLLKCLVINPFIILEEITAVKIHFSRCTKLVSCLMWLLFFPLGFCVWTYKGVQIAPPQIPAVPPVLGCSLLPKRLLCEQIAVLKPWMCCWAAHPSPGVRSFPGTSWKERCTEERKTLLPSADLLLLWCPAACPPVDSAHPSGEGWKSKTWNALWIGVSIRKSAFGFLKIVHILFFKKWNG